MNHKIRQAIADLFELSASTSNNKWLALVLGESLDPVIHTPAEAAEIRSYLQAAKELIDRNSRELIKVELQETVAVLSGETTGATYVTARTLKAVNLFNGRGDHQGLHSASLQSTARFRRKRPCPALPSLLNSLSPLAHRKISASKRLNIASISIEQS